LVGALIFLVLLLMRLNSGQGLSTVYVIGCGAFTMLFLLSVVKASQRKSN
jgi:hypothetical protein